MTMRVTDRKRAFENQSSFTIPQLLIDKTNRNWNQIAIVWLKDNGGPMMTVLSGEPFRCPYMNITRRYCSLSCYHDVVVRQDVMQSLYDGLLIVNVGHITRNISPRRP